MGNIFRRFDQTGQPIKFNWRGETVHTSIVGGVCSVIAMLLTIPFGLIMLLSIYSAGFNILDADAWLDSATNDVPFNISTTQTIPALKWGTQFETPYNVSEYITAVFLQTYATKDDQVSFNYIPAAKCFEEITTDTSFKDNNIYSL
jgi:hypothetical protein